MWHNSYKIPKIHLCCPRSQPAVHHPGLSLSLMKTLRPDRELQSSLQATLLIQNPWENCHSPSPEVGWWSHNNVQTKVKVNPPSSVLITSDCCLWRSRNSFNWSFYFSVYWFISLWSNLLLTVVDQFRTFELFSPVFFRWETSQTSDVCCLLQMLKSSGDTEGDGVVAVLAPTLWSHRPRLFGRFLRTNVNRFYRSIFIDQHSELCCPCFCCLVCLSLSFIFMIGNTWNFLSYLI